MMMRLLSRPLQTVSLLVLASGLCGCSLAPDYTQPDMASPASYRERDGWKSAQPADTMPKGAWWEIFGDQELNALEARVPQGNPSLKAGLARLEQARALVQNARADYFPKVDGSAGNTRARRSGTTTPDTLPNDYSDHRLALTVSYEVDLWGRVKNSVEAAHDEALASAGDFATLELSLRAELAADYFAIRSADSAQAILDQTVLADQAALDLVIRRHSGGIANASDLAQAQAQLEGAKTQAADNRLKRAQLEHAIAVLVGVAPSQFNLPPQQWTAHVPTLDPGQPSSLLERRPDVAAAERRVAEANARIGVAEAAWYPVFDLGGLLGLESGSPSLFQASSAIWALGPGTLTQNIFDGGRKQAVSDQAKAVFSEAAANYRHVTLSAWQEVEDQLVALAQLEREADTQQRAVMYETEALNQARLRYQAGIVTYLEVVVSQNTLLAGQLTANDILLRRMTADVLLIKGLGGGWRKGEGS